MNAWLFPGQGSQRKGMGAELFPRFPEWVRQADEILGYSIERLCLEDPHNQLNLTTYTQPAIYVVSWLGYLAALEGGAWANIAAGHSVGEYAALTAAGALDFGQGLRIVIERARLMAKVEGAGLVAVLGHDQQHVQQLLDGLPGLGLEIANINSPRQIVVGGPRPALQALVEHCANNACRGVLLRVSGPFHTSHMREVEQPFRDFLQHLSQDFREPAFKVIANLTARPHTRDGLVDALSRHLTHPVQWQGVIEYALAEGVQTFIEIGQPPILGAMINDIRTFAPAAPAQPAPRPTVPAPRDTEWLRRLGAARPLLVGALGLGTDAPRLLGALAQHGAFGLLDSDELTLTELEHRLQQLNAMPGLSGRFGVALTGPPRPPMLELLARERVRCVAVNDLDITARDLPLIREYLPDAMLLVHISRQPSLEDFFGAADALLIDADSQLPLLLEALTRREHLTVDTRPLIGAGGLVGSPACVQAMLELGADFVGVGSAFVLCREAGLTPDTQTRLGQLSQTDHRTLPDWRYPELASHSACYALDADIAEQAQALQALYLSQQGGDGTSLQACLNTFALPPFAFTAVDVLDPLASPRALRLELQRRMQQVSRQRLLRGDASLWLFNRWRLAHCPEIPLPLPAAQLLDLLCPLTPLFPLELARNTA